ncbi:MAG: dUTPase [Eubacteriales bacterium]|nr:dUTPase [Eubacteriales bacterium]
MDKLEQIFTMQQALNADIRERRGLEELTHEAWIQKQMLAMLCEMAEVLEETNYKWWKNPKAVDSDALKEEMVDVLHFFVSMCLESGMDAQELYDRYLAKNAENFARQQGRSSKPGYELPDAEG